MNDHAFWPGTKMLRTVVYSSGADDPRVQRRAQTNNGIRSAEPGAGDCADRRRRCEQQYFAALRNHSPSLAGIPSTPMRLRSMPTNFRADRQSGRKPDASSIRQSRSAKPGCCQFAGNDDQSASGGRARHDQQLSPDRRVVRSLRSSVEKLIDDIVRGRGMRRQAREPAGRVIGRKKQES